MNLLIEKRKHVRGWLIILFCLLIIYVISLGLWIQLEGEKPNVNIQKLPKSLGISNNIELSLSDLKTGMRKIRISLSKDGRDITLLEKYFPEGIFGRNTVHEELLNFKVEPRRLGLTDGKGTLKISAIDLSWRNWGAGNETIIENNILIDTAPLMISILTKAHNLSQGGTGLVIYKLSKECQNSGIYVGENFFPAYNGYFDDKTIFISFFALSYDIKRDVEIFIKASDLAGNVTKMHIPHHIKYKIFRKEIINISDSFLATKALEFNITPPKDSQTSLVDIFLKINRESRKIDSEKILSLGKKTDKILYWENSFLRMPNTAPMARFADHRSYKHNNNIIDSQTHLGVDLASLMKSRIPAANKGKVVLVGFMGIYGNTVAIDHGFGLFSMYSHLSSFNVKEGQIVSKGDIVGNTGTTGLAGGDHLHYAMFVYNTFVDPIEWWDLSWIKNNITSKIEEVRGIKQ
ncbi:MAG: M23 family metallopeptidase [Desulfobacterales bacterium]|nr:M23 family metallopeptidase [Desulfobacterales bacterium]